MKRQRVTMRGSTVLLPALSIARGVAVVEW
jgi:hypothetical protein